MKTKVKHYRLQVTMSFEEFTQFGDAVKAHLTRISPYSLCGDIIRIQKIWINKENFDVFHPVFSDYTKLIGVTDRFIYYALPTIERRELMYHLNGALVCSDPDLYRLLLNHIY